MNRPAVLSLVRTAGLAMLLTTLAAVSFATTLAPLSIESMTGLADEVVQGTVSSVESRYSADRSQIFTYVTLRSSEFLKGEGATEVRFLLWGGRVGDDELTIVGSPAFAVGEDVVVFLSDMDSRVPLAVQERRWLTGLSNGKWSVALDGASGARTARSAAAPAATPALTLGALRARIAAAQSVTLPNAGGR